MTRWMVSSHSAREIGFSLGNVVGIKMIFIQEREYGRQIDLIETLSNMFECDLVAWVYPDSKIDLLFEIPLQEASLINADPCTTYEGQLKVRCTPRMPITDDFVKIMRDDKKTVDLYCDSLCIYSVNDRKWLACIVGHEGMILVDRSDLFGALGELDFSVSNSPPDWW